MVQKVRVASSEDYLLIQTLQKKHTYLLICIIKIEMIGHEGQGILTRRSRRIFSAGGMAFTPTKWMEQVWKDSSNSQHGGSQNVFGQEGSIDTKPVSLSIINGDNSYLIGTQ